MGRRVSNRQQLRSDLIEILRRYGNVPLPSRQRQGRTKALSAKTFNNRRRMVLQFPEILERQGCCPQYARNLTRRHMATILRDMEERGLSAATLQEARMNCGFVGYYIGKPGIADRLWEELDDPSVYTRDYGAHRVRAWSLFDREYADVAQKVWAMDPVVYTQLMLQCTLGLRPKEAMLFQPAEDIKGMVVHVHRGTKTGRPRTFQIPWPESREALREARAMSEFLGGRNLISPDWGFARAQQHFYYVMEYCGVTWMDRGITPYGFRHWFARRLYRELSGRPAPVDEPGHPVVVEHREYNARKIVVEALGAILQNYLGRLETLKAYDERRLGAERRKEERAEKYRIERRNYRAKLKRAREAREGAVAASS